ncbi:hypothetical protein PAXINDRAFT_169609 [Paxillus involutus ATCC 200175]|uniref:Uncharacterized protein n=1 Tax=Paxillus involutus ATCC 200175 TaxID=664439 RepID=A0A0C9TWT6_PAXIN|nr:hypothetical protein PAXINDRAFT_169609 [Paxillus involutus ATCC 200175]
MQQYASSPPCSTLNILFAHYKRGFLQDIIRGEASFEHVCIDPRVQTHQGGRTLYSLISFMNTTNDTRKSSSHASFRHNADDGAQDYRLFSLTNL